MRDPRPALAAGFAVNLVVIGACAGTPRAPASTPMPAPPASLGDLPVPAPAPHRTPPATDAVKVRSLGGIDEYVLGNGMSVLLFADPSQPTVTVNVTYLVGSRHEGYGETGMAHLLEHMLFKGTPTHAHVMQLLEERGAFYNASTWTDRTNYYETLPATGDNLRFAIGLEADRMINATISAADLATEFSVVRNELEAGENDPTAILEERVMSTAYLWHNYGKSTIGSRSDVEHVPADRLRAFYTRYYQPGNAVLVVAGKFDTAAALDDIEATFGAVPRSAQPPPPTYTVEPVQDGERTVTLRRTGDVHVLMAAYHAVAAADPDFVAFRALRFILADEPSGRLYRALAATGLASDVSSALAAFRDPNAITFTARARDARTVAAARTALLAVVEGVGTSPITAAELERWRAATLRSLTLQLSDSQQTALELSEWAAAGDWRLLFAYREQVKAMTVDTVNRVATSYLIASNRTFGEFVPTRDPVRAPAATAPDLAAAVGKLVVPALEAGEVFSVDLDNLAARTQLRTLAGGLAAAFVPRKTRGGKVMVQITLRHGDAKRLSGKATIAELTGALAERGTRRRSYAALEDDKSRLVADLSVDGGAGWVTVRVATVRASLPAVLELVAEILKTPALDGKELEVVRRQAVAELEEALTDPERLGAVELERTMAPWPAAHPLATMTVAARLAAVRKVTLAQVRAYHADFWGGGAGEVVAVGDFDADQLAAQLERDLGTWTATARFVRIPDRAFDVAAAARTIDTRDKEMAIVTGGHDLALTDDHPDAAALEIASWIFGGGSRSRLWVRMREQEGWSYGAWGFADPGDRDPAGRLGFGAILAPQNAAAGQAAMIEELTRLVTSGVTADEVAVAKQAWLEQQENLLSADDDLADALARGRELGRDWSWSKRRRAEVAALTAADVERVIKTWFKPERVVTVIAGDQAKARAMPTATPTPTPAPAPAP